MINSDKLVINNNVILCNRRREIIKYFRKMNLFKMKSFCKL